MTELRAGLYVVATPIGNLQDVSQRAMQVLAAATVVAAEDTRTSRKLLRLAGGRARTVSLTEHNVDARAPQLLGEAGRGVVVLVSDAGTPLIADPGARLVEAAHAEGVPVFAIPGPSALAAALSVAGFEVTDAHFLGFLPRPRGERLARLRAAAGSASVLVFFESPNRLSATLAELASALGDPEVVVCRELTKLHEEVVRGPASTLASRFDGTRGECTVVLRTVAAEEGNEDEALIYLGEMRRAGARRPRAAAEAARRFGIARQRAYELWEHA